MEEVLYTSQYERKNAYAREMRQGGGYEEDRGARYGLYAGIFSYANANVLKRSSMQAAGDAPNNRQGELITAADTASICRWSAVSAK